MDYYGPLWQNSVREHVLHVDLKHGKDEVWSSLVIAAKTPDHQRIPFKNIHMMHVTLSEAFHLKQSSPNSDGVTVSL